MPLHRRPATRSAAVRSPRFRAPRARREAVASERKLASGSGVRRAFSSAGVTAMDAQTKKRTLRLLSNGVYVLTSRSEDRYGAATVTWVSQASFKPPLIMVAVRTESNVFKCLAESRSAGLHIVGDRQQGIARRFFFPTHVLCGTTNGGAFIEGRTAASLLPNLPAHNQVALEPDLGT